MTHILMVAAENGALPGGKVGGIGDVVREVPTALAQRDCAVSVVTPAYGVFHRLPGAQRVAQLKVNFGGAAHSLELFRLDGIESDPAVHHYVIEHSLFSRCGVGKIYCDDPPERPFETDASKFALFCMGVAEGIKNGTFDAVDRLHLHDWHAAFLLILRRYDPSYRALQSLRCVYSIHNLAIQGIRPFGGSDSSLERWYPGLKYDRRTLADPQWSDCVNPVAAAIRMADAVHTVSPSYAAEILLPSDPAHGFFGGERLQNELRDASQQQRLFGILNGCEYPQKAVTAVNDWPSLLRQMRELIVRWASRERTLASAHFIAHHALQRLGEERPAMILTSVGRITAQKVGLMREPTSSGQAALHAALQALGGDGILLMVGSGDSDHEQFLSESAAIYDNFVFLRGFSDTLADSLYRQGDLFFMPSSFEPCGISQMLALRAGQPCLVHGVGGLRDTIVDNRTGFVFSGKNPTEQADALVATLKRALIQQRKQSAKWRNMRKAAAAARFTWSDSIDAYLRQLYQIE